MSEDQRLIQRSIKSAREEHRGTIVVRPYQEYMDPNTNTSLVWFVDVDIGTERLLRKVLVSGGSSLGGRQHAKLGRSVVVTRNSGGRWIVTGPADRVLGSGPITLLDERDDSESSGGNYGFTVVKEPFAYYAGDLPGTPNSGLWGTAGFPKITILDGDGNEV